MTDLNAQLVKLRKIEEKALAFGNVEVARSVTTSYARVPDNYEHPCSWGVIDPQTRRTLLMHSVYQFDNDSEPSSAPCAADAEDEFSAFALSLAQQQKHQQQPAYEGWHGHKHKYWKRVPYDFPDVPAGHVVHAFLACRYDWGKHDYYDHRVHEHYFKTKADADAFASKKQSDSTVRSVILRRFPDAEKVELVELEYVDMNTASS